MGGVDPPGAVPVDDPVPVAVPGAELPVDVLDAVVDEVVTVAPSVVVDVESPGVPLVSVDGVPVGVGVSVGVVEDPPVVAEVLLSAGALGLTPPPLSAVDVPPVARSLIFTGVVVVIEVEIGAGGPGLVDALAVSPLATPGGGCVRAISGKGEADPGSLEWAVRVAARSGAAGAAGATMAGRAWW